MRKRPTAGDREIADYLRSLPIGQHSIIVEAANDLPHLKPEGGLVFSHEGHRCIIIPGVKR